MKQKPIEQQQATKSSRELTVQRILIDALEHDRDNARRHTRKNLDTIAASLEHFGQQKPIVIDKHNRIIAGHGTVVAAKALGWHEIQAVRSDLEDHQAIAYALADNRTAELAQWRPSKLAEQLATLQIDPAELDDVTGFDEEQIQQAIDTAAGLASPAVSSSDSHMVFGLLVTCADEAEQKKIFQSLVDEGVPCRVLTL